MRTPFKRRAQSHGRLIGLVNGVELLIIVSQIRIRVKQIFYTTPSFLATAAVTFTSVVR